jgi:hypothetical protein
MGSRSVVLRVKCELPNKFNTESFKRYVEKVLKEGPDTSCSEWNVPVTGGEIKKIRSSIKVLPYMK